MSGVRVAIVGAGLIGVRHAAAIAACEGVALGAIVEPAASGPQIAASYGVPCFSDLSGMLDSGLAQGVIIATPNRMHVPQTLTCLDRGLPVLVEKPLADTLQGAQQIVDAAKETGTAVLTGHHRRHNALIAKAKEQIDAGHLGQIAAVNALTWFHKPEDYFDVEWRRQKGAGPVYINLIHDVDLLRHLCGEIVEVTARESRMVRGFEVEDTAAILLRFASGALGTMSVSDTIAAPWSWELTARENPAYPATPEACYLIGGSRGSLSLPNLSLWAHEGPPHWWTSIRQTRLPYDLDDPLIRQVRHFAAVIRGDEAPLVPALEGLRNQAVLEAVKTSALSGESVVLAG